MPRPATAWRASGARRRKAGGRLPGRPHHDRHRPDRSHRPATTSPGSGAQRARRRQARRRPRHPARRLLPGHLHVQHHARLEPRRPVRDPPAPALERRAVVAGPPGIRRQYASDVIISDSVLAKGYAYASTDKGNSGPRLYNDGVQAGRRDRRVALPRRPSSPWPRRTSSPSATTTNRGAPTSPGSPPPATSPDGSWRTSPSLYDGGIAWSGVLMTPERNLLSYLPTALGHYPQYAATAPRRPPGPARRGLPRGSEPTWAYSHRNFWDPSSGSCGRSSTPPSTVTRWPATPSAQRHPRLRRRLRPQVTAAEVKDAFARISLTGRIGKPLLTLQGPSTPRSHRATPGSTPRWSKNQGRGAHVPAVRGRGRQPLRGPVRAAPEPAPPDAALLPGRLRSTRGVDHQGTKPPASHVVTRDASTDLVNTCDL